MAGGPKAQEERDFDTEHRQLGMAVGTIMLITTLSTWKDVLRMGRFHLKWLQRNWYYRGKPILS